MADSYNNPDAWDGRYANGDDLNYYAGLIRERVLAKPANSTEGLKFNLDGGLIWNHYGRVNNAFPKLAVDPGKGIYLQKTVSSASHSYDKVNIWLYEKSVAADSSAGISAGTYNMSGLDFFGGEDTYETYGPLGIDLEQVIVGTSDPVNTSGLEIAAPFTKTSGAITFSGQGGLRLSSTIAGTGLEKGAGSNGEYKLNLKKATTSELGGIKAANVRSSAITTTSGGTTGTYCGVELDSDGKAFVHVNADVNTWRPVQVGSQVKQTSATNSGNLIFYGTPSIDVSFDDEPHAVVFDVKLCPTGGLGVSNVNPKGLKVNTGWPIYINSNNDLDLNYGDGLTVYTPTGQGDNYPQLIVNLDSSSNNPLHFYSGGLNLALGRWSGLLIGRQNPEDNTSPYALWLDYSIFNGGGLETRMSGSQPLGAGIKVYSSRSLATTPSSGTASNYYGLELNTADNRPFIAVPNANTTGKGVVQLVSTINDINKSDSTTAATPSAVDGWVSAMATTLRSEFEALNTEFVVVSALPTGSDINKQNIYLLEQSPSGGNSYYTEWVYVKSSPTSSTYQWEKIGDTSFELSNLGAYNVSAIIAAAFGF